VQEGVLRPNDISQRALISTIGSFGNGGLVAAFAVFYYPYLPKLGGQIKSLCAVGTVLIAIGFGTAAASHNVRRTLCTTVLLVADMKTASNTCGMPGCSGRSRSRDPHIRSYTHSAGVLSGA
jgi:hypothetical protein